MLTEVGNVAAMLASDHASPLTATVVNGQLRRDCRLAAPIRTYWPTGQCSTVSSLIGKSFGFPVVNAPSFAHVVAATKQSL